MKIKKIVEILCVAAFLFTVGCSPADNSSSSDSVPSKPVVNTVYEEIPQYPKYSDVDMQGYTVYYFDSEAGDDDNDGLSKQSPKRTAGAAARVIAKVNEASPSAILFKAGSSYDTVLKAEKFEATEEKPLIISVYDATEQEKYARFSAAPNCVEVTAGNVRIS